MNHSTHQVGLLMQAEKTNTIRPIKAARAIVLMLAFIGIAAAIHRALLLLQLIPASAPPGAQGFDSGFGHYPVLTFIHITAGSIFLVLGCLLFIRRRKQRPAEQGRQYGMLIAGYIMAITALLLSYSSSIGGFNETAATNLFALFEIISLTCALICLRKQQEKQVREWLIRAFSIGLAIATVRLINVLFFILSHLSPHEFFGIAFWIGFTLHLVAAEIWIRLGEKRN